MPTIPPDLIQIPSPPPLLPDHHLHDLEPTNTHALLLPHLSLFSPTILGLLRQHYEQYGIIAHWAPVKAFGRVIVVWTEIDDASRAKKFGDYLKLDINISSTSTIDPQMTTTGFTTSVTAHEVVVDESESGTLMRDGMYFSPKRKKRQSRTPPRGYVPEPP